MAIAAFAGKGHASDAATIAPRSRHRIEKSFKGYVPNVAVGVVRFRPVPSTYEELFNKKKPFDTVGSNILVLRQWMACNGYPECPDFTPREFANFFDRHHKGLCLRSQWRHFERTAAGERDARQFLAKMASELLPEVTASAPRNADPFAKAVGWSVEAAQLHGMCLS